MELRHMRYFITVAEELHFGRAASRLNISQPPLSVQIRQLEQELGFPLLLRSKHHVQLTEAGKVFLEEARLTIAHVEKSLISAEKAHRGATGRLEIGFVGSTTYNIVSLLQTFRLRYPSVNLVLHQMKSENQLQALNEESIHLGIVRNPVNNPFLNYELVQREPFVAVLPRSHPMSDRKKIRVSDLAGEPFIMTSRRHGASYYDASMRICHQAGYSPNIVLEVPEILTKVAFVSAGIGVAIVPASFREQQNKGVVFCELEGTSVDLEMGMIWRKDEKSPTLHTFLGLVQEYHEDSKST